MSIRKRHFLLPGALLCASVAAFGQFTDPTTIIEVGDGNTTQEGICDWDTLNGSNPTNATNTPAGTCPSANIAGINAYVFLKGDQNEKNFTGGGSKDPIDIPSWKWSSGSTPDKDTLTNGYAVSYSSTSGHKILAFGAERFAVNGDANIGVWFFQQPVGPNGSGTFDGVHTPGDVFAVSAFTNGGSHPGLDVYSWDPGCSASNYKVTLPVPLGGECAATNLRLIFSGAAGSTDLCSGDPGCTSVNGATITPAWPYATKFGGGTTVPLNGFFEGGFDLTAIFPGGAPGCFSSFLVETRSSQSPTAVLKDFLSGSFPECKISLTQACACSAFHADGSGFDYGASGTVTNDGGGTVFNVTVTDPSINGTYTCSSLTKGQTKKWGDGAGAGDCTGAPNTFSSTQNPATNQAFATASTSSSGGSTINAQTNLGTCSTGAACVPSPAINVTKNCVTGFQVQGSNVAIRVDYTGVVTNTGQDNLGNVTVVDAAVGTPASQTFTVGTLTPGQAKCYTNNAATCPTLTPQNGLSQATPGAGFYYPSNATLIAPGRASFTDRVTATGKDVILGNTVTATADATCLICPFGFCPTAP